MKTEHTEAKTLPAPSVGSGDLLGVSVYGGKYTIQCDGDGRMRALRYGQPWRDLTGDGMVLALVQEIQRLRQRDNILTDAMAEVMATSSGKSTQPIATIVNGCIAELRGLSA